MKVLVIAELNQNQINESTLKTITAAKQLGNVSVLVAGFQCREAATKMTQAEGVEKVLYCDHESYQHALAESLSALIVDLASEFDYLIAPASTYGKNIMPRVAALLNVGQISDVIKIEAADIFKRPIYAGNAIATVQSLDKKKVLTIRPSAFAAAKYGDAKAALQSLEKNEVNTSSEFVTQALTESTRPELNSARVVISGGRGLQNGENFKLLEQLADKLGAAVGASRAAVDAGFVPNDYQVGQTGKIIAPELYFAIGISGAIQHLAGMKESKIIVAINKDADAPIFKVADYGLVGDLFEIVPELIKIL